MKTVPQLDLAPTPAVSDASRKLSTAFSINFPRSIKSREKNLLENSLTIKLKHHRHEFSSNKENVFETRLTKSQRRCGSQANEEQKSTLPPRSNSVSRADRNDSAGSSVNSSQKVAIKHGKNGTLVTGTSTGQVERASTSSDLLPKLARRKSSTFNPSRRSSSAGPTVSRVSLASRMTSASSFFHSSESSGLALESHGADYTIKVVKKDGVFKPVDKYASNRYLTREIGPGERTKACDYELFTLAVPNEGTTFLKPDSRNAYTTEASRRPLKVSWSKNTGNTTSGEIETLESRMDSAPLVTPNNLIRVLSSSSYKRPVYSSGKSQIESIGLRWRVSTAPPDNEVKDIKIQQPSSNNHKNPMWSWLITPETKKKKRVKNVGELSRGSKNSSQPSMSHANSNQDVRTQHSRDLHPVSTAMAREGTSVSKTKWLVPSSSTGTLEAERIAMDCLEFVKRDRKIRSDYIVTTDNLDDTYRNTFGDNILDGNEESTYEEIDTRRKQMDDTASYGTKSIVDTINSPTKTRSTRD